MWNNPKQIWQPEQSQRMKRTEQRHATYNNLNQFFLFLKENLRTHWTTCNNLKHCSADWGATKTAKEQVVTSSNSNTTTAEDNLEKLKQVKQQKNCTAITENNLNMTEKWQFNNAQATKIE